MVFRSVGNNRQEELRSYAVENLSPELVVNRGTAQFSHLWMRMKNFLKERGDKICLNHRRFTNRTTTDTNYIDPDDNSTSNELAKNIVSKAILNSGTESNNNFSTAMIERKMLTMLPCDPKTQRIRFQATLAGVGKISKTDMIKLQRATIIRQYKNANSLYASQKGCSSGCSCQGITVTVGMKRSRLDRNKNVLVYLQKKLLFTQQSA